MKVVIQIPCFNEQQTLPQTLMDLPKSLPGIDEVEWLIIDDGSSDATSAIAEQFRVHHIVRLPTHRGLAEAFRVGIETCLVLDADIIVNTDADNQYPAKDIPKLIAPIVSGESDFVVGVRPLSTMKHFSLAKRLLSIVGSYLVKKISNTDVTDATSGFRAVSRNAAMALNIFTNYTYTLETLIQAGHCSLRVTSVPVGANPVKRPSRLMSSTLSYLINSFYAIAKILLVYRPFKTLAFLGIVIGGVGCSLCLFQGQTSYRFEVGFILVLIGVQFFTSSLLANVASVNRKLLENIQFQLRASGKNYSFHRARSVVRSSRISGRTSDKSISQNLLS